VSANPLSFDALRETNVARSEAAFQPIADWTPTDWATAVAGETGEACNLVKKLRRLDGPDRKLDTTGQREYLTREIGKELADIVIYCG
jgi:NTP pyrophosphatase (non-canonical NTP hydrolase)